MTVLEGEDYRQETRVGTRGGAGGRAGPESSEESGERVGASGGRRRLLAEPQPCPSRGDFCLTQTRTNFPDRVQQKTKESATVTYSG